MTEQSPHTPHRMSGQSLAETLNPGMEAALVARYDRWLPGAVAETVVGHGMGAVYSREGLDLKTRLLVTVGALAALGGQTRPQLKVNIGSALRAGAAPREITEAIFQMHLYGGMPAMINALNAALEVFEEAGIEAEGAA
ncbi:carboxymuconolactone decarboxylase family protein [Acidimangrovimonas sediminis]|uniref:carboxymuconolactone decarboxylase family protein n=1 Tax=Acidimangrovimonas sediminis TaxID=2056283 RepID=UPI001E64BB2B|nr:carboxymuconolactone decarboxylase family protein [Acidimangrovimonas sediminis]